MPETATITFPDGRTANISGPDKESVRRRIGALREQQRQEEAKDLPSLDDPTLDSNWQPGFQGTSDGRPSHKSARIDAIARDAAEDVGAVVEVGMTMATGFVAEVISGAAGATGLLVTFGDVDRVVPAMKEISNALTYVPRGERGKKLINDVAIPLVALERNADTFAEVASMGNPFAATAIKTTILGGLELAWPGKKSVQTIRAHREIRAQQKALVKEAEAIGIDFDPKNIQASTIDAILKMTPEQRAANSSIIQDALKKAASDHKKTKDLLFEDAIQRRAFIEKASVKEFGANERSRLEGKGVDLDPGVEKMGPVRKSVDELESFGSKFESDGLNLKSIHLNELEKIRRRVGQRYGSEPQVNRALTIIKKDIDVFLDQQFNKSAISGDPAAIKAWTDARASNTLWHKNFSENKVIADLINKEATPETVSQWLIGASSMRAKSEAASVVNRIKRVLGDNHPAVEGIRQDFFWGVAEPILRDTPNFGQFVKNYETMMKRNPSLTKALNFDNASMDHLYRISKAQADLPVPTIKTLDLYRSLAQATVGHDIARKALAVRLSASLLRLATGADKVTKKALIAELTGSVYDRPFIPKRGPLAAEFIAGAALTSIPADEEDK